MRVTVPTDVRKSPSSCLHLLPTTEQAGAETRARELIGGLRDGGRVDVELAYFRAGRGHAGFAALGCPLHLIEQRRRMSLDFPRLAMGLRKLFRDRPPDILHTWLITGNVVGLLAARAWPDTRVIVTQCGGRAERLLFPKQLRLQKALIKRADHAISNSTDGASDLEKQGLPGDRTSVVVNGVAPERVELSRSRDAIRAEIEVGGSVPLIAVGARATERESVRQKNVAGMLDVMGLVRNRHADAELLLIGPSHGQLESFGIALPPWARCTGFVDRAADYLAASDVVAVPSIGEGTSNVACEALMLGLPVATTETGDHVPIVLEAGGRTAAVGDSRGLSEAVCELLARPPAPHEVRAVANRRLGLDRMVDETVGIYERVLAEASAGSADRVGQVEPAAQR